MSAARPSNSTERLGSEFYRRDARQVARDLLGRTLVTIRDGVRTSGRIIETEAYIGDGSDAASHTHRGPTERNRPMFLDGGHVYVYFIYGMYHCVNVVTGTEGHGAAVLLRGIEPLEGLEIMRERRIAALRRRRPAADPPRINDADIANGPGKLTVALGIDPDLNGADLTSGRSIWIERGVPIEDGRAVATTRIGISKAVDHLWRWIDAAHVRQRRSGP